MKNESLKSNRVRILAGLALVVVALGSQPLFAWCEGGVVSGVHNVYKCDETCWGGAPNQLSMWVRRNCVIVCCPDGTAMYNTINCDNEEWDFMEGVCCPAGAPYTTPGYEFLTTMDCPTT